MVFFSQKTKLIRQMNTWSSSISSFSWLDTWTDGLLQSTIKRLSWSDKRTGRLHKSKALADQTNKQIVFFNQQSELIRQMQRLYSLIRSLCWPILYSRFSSLKRWIYIANCIISASALFEKSFLPTGIVKKFRNLSLTGLW